jgi:hypothetical protein
VETVQSTSIYHDELVDFLASAPSREQLLNFRPSEEVRRRARGLLAKIRDGSLTNEEQQELDQFEQAELLMQLICARIHAQKAARP